MEIILLKDIPKKWSQMAHHYPPAHSKKLVWANCHMYIRLWRTVIPNSFKSIH